MDRVDQARVVIVGGGITGCSIALHLARAGWREIVLLDKGPLTSGSTCQAAGLVTMFNPSSTMMRFRRYSIELYRELGVFETVGSLRFASTRDQLKELQRGASRARGIGLDVEVISAAEARALMPAASPESLYGAVHIAGDGHLDPHRTTHAVADAAKALGVTIRTGVRVTGIELDARRAVRAVLTEQGRIATETVVNAAGMWAPRVAAMVGAFVPSTPVDHQHVALKAVPGAELPHDMPCFRDPDNLVYGKSEAGGVLFGGYEAEPHARWVDGVPWEHSATALQPDLARFEPLMAGAIRRFPFLADAEMVRLVNHPDAMTPDANPLLGPIPGVPGFWMAAGLSLNGFGGAGGIGRVMAEWMTSGDPDLDVHPYRTWRFADTYRDPMFAAAGGREAYRYYYLLRYPYDADEEGRPRRLSAVHTRLQDAGAVFGTKHGWERPDLFEPGRPWRRAGADQRAYGWTTPPWFERVGAEHRAVRERAGLIDLSSFGKIRVDGRDALGLLERVAAGRMDRPVGAVTYTQFLDRRAGIVADVTVTRLGETSFRVVTGAGYVASDLGWLRLHVRDGELVTLADESDAFACFGLWGPRARDILAAASGDDVSDTALPLRRAGQIGVGGAAVLAQRISYAGELGWELYAERSRAISAWDAIVAAGAAHGLEHVGYRALDSLRMEKGYRYYGTDLTMLDTPLEAGMLAFVALGEADFIGRDALLARRDAGPPATRIRTVLVGEGPGYLPVYGGEAVRLDGAVAGRLRSAAYGFGVDRTVGYVYLPSNLPEGAALEVDMFDERVPATVAADVLVDPAGERMRG